VEHRLHRNKNIQSTHANEVPSAASFALPRNQNDVVRLALRALLRIFHRETSSRYRQQEWDCASRATANAVMQPIHDRMVFSNS
jgi:hypothetical protein